MVSKKWVGEGGCEQELGEECEGASRKWAGV